MEPSVAAVCRICQGEGGPLIRPCRCEGSMAYAHPYCLAEWIASRGRLSCEVCGAAYSFQLAVRDTPSLRSIRGAAQLTVLFIRTLLRRWFVRLGIAGQVAACLVTLIFGTSAIWVCCWRCVARGRLSLRGQYIPLPLLCIMSVLLNIIPGGLLVCYERFKVLAFVYEDAIEDLPPVVPAPLPPETPMDEAAAAALNIRFTSVHSDHNGSGAPAPATHRYVAIRQTGMNTGSVLQLLRKKVKEATKPSQRNRIWDNAALRYIALFLLIHVALASAVVLGDATQQSLALLTRLLTVISIRFALNRSSPLWALLTEALAAAPLSSPLYWCSAFIVGIMTLLYPLRLAAAHLASSHAQLSRTLSLVCVFARSALSIVMMVVVWATVIPCIVYACLFPFFVEGDASVVMAPTEAWQILRSERLLPFVCRGASVGPLPPPVRPLTQPLNVARALFFAAPDVWRGRSPSLFDPVSCGLESQRTSTQGSFSLAVHFGSFCGCVLLRVSTLATWLTLVGTLRATSLWLLSGAFAVLLPYTSLANCFHDQHDFFRTFVHLKGRGFWRVLGEVPAFVVLYTITVGVATFATLHRLSPDAFPRSVSYLSFYTLTHRFSELDFVYSWYRIIKAAHSGVQTGLERLFLSRDASFSDSRLASQADQVLERGAYVVCLLCANVLIGVLLERASWNGWFPLFGFLLNLGCLSWLGMVVGGGLPSLRRRLAGCGIRATMLCFYGIWVTFEEGDVCVCNKLSRGRSNVIAASLLRHSFEHNDLWLSVFFTQLLDHHDTEAIRCSRELLLRIMSHTLNHVGTCPRPAVAATLLVVVPFGLCSAWHLDFVTPVSTDYIALPLWFSLLARWAIGALAGGAWVLVEGRVLRTALFRRCLEFAPQVIMEGPSLETTHAVLIPLVIHCVAVRLVIAGLEYLYGSALATDYTRLPVMAAAVLILLAVVHMRVKNALWRFGRHVVAEGVRGGQRGARPAAPAPPPLVEPPQHPMPPRLPVEHAPEWHDVPVEAAEEAAEEDQVDVNHVAPAPDAHPPPRDEFPQHQPKHSSFMSRLQERIAQWAASESATDVVLVDYANPSSPSPPS
ncbi:hypothetical protein ABB37_09577 [Leptomonas pyrrhocoris]|uniref:RING-CH-type domain-containing protein n=1 Tax=Leptomonas pyrrhocoris TaxID=157538 RepID=A0A0N0DR74_LEPPY|nr:hypothetical protein ABB37_09577 [Leptomonas pyrrhocoris]XP_015652461.1 hypothetical protein ABB37_09577 [Leptomonas pyrrhocoris]KPA74021.1 hypothetical protein ABB37_09577 [Leptomonas pyrrhocoris]KPA74022.1 hypothetical protein ABB37_09577 [Leptomonas pyrrhocoris]|eukprot:XP_015652460.1 hypothetical protein ABB37_09577 [Leptomonas pyrrhocoris]